MEAVVGWEERDLYEYPSSSFPTSTYWKGSVPLFGFTAVLNAIVPFASLSLVKVGVPTNGLCVAVTVTLLAGTSNDVVVGLVSVTSSEVHSLKGMGSPLSLVLVSGVMFTVSFSRKFPLLFACLTPGPVSVPSLTVTV